MDDHDRPHRLTRDLEDLEDLDGSTIFDARALDDDEADEADASPTHAERDEDVNASEGGGDPEPREGASMAPADGVPETWPQRRRRAVPAHERRPLPQRMRGRGVACVVVLFNDGRKVVLR